MLNKPNRDIKGSDSPRSRCLDTSTISTGLTSLSSLICKLSSLICKKPSLHLTLNNTGSSSPEKPKTDKTQKPIDRLNPSDKTSLTETQTDSLGFLFRIET